MNELVKIYLVRHGDTAWTLSRQHTGSTDIPLTPHGEEQAQALAKRVRKIEFAEVLSSPMQRASHTAELAGFTPAIEPLLREWNYGDYEGLTTLEIQKKQPNWNVFRDGCPGGESHSQVSKRADEFVAMLRKKQGNIAVFSHAHFLRVIAARWINEPVELAQHLLLGTTSVSVLGFEHHKADEPVIELWNETCSL